MLVPRALSHWDFEMEKTSWPWWQVLYQPSVFQASVAFESLTTGWLQVFPGFRIPICKPRRIFNDSNCKSRNSQWFPKLSRRCFFPHECKLSRLTLWDPLDYNPPGSPRIFQARILMWVAISSSRGSFWPRDRTHVSRIGSQILYRCAKWPKGKLLASDL